MCLDIRNIFVWYYICTLIKTNVLIITNNHQFYNFTGDIITSPPIVHIRTQRILNVECTICRVIYSMNNNIRICNKQCSSMFKLVTVYVIIRLSLIYTRIFSERIRECPQDFIKEGGKPVNNFL